MARPRLDELVERATRSELFTAPRLQDDLQSFLAEHAGAARALAGEARKRAIDTVYFVGSGGSWASMYSGKYLLDRVTTLPGDVMYSYELCWRRPHRLGPGALVFLASYSGKTEDTLAALQCAKLAGAYTVALVKTADSPLGKAADAVIAYGSTALYMMPAIAVSLFVLQWALDEGDRSAQAVLDGIAALPPILGWAYENDREPCEQLARDYVRSSLLYCVGAGPLFGLAYKFALTVFMENIRTHGSVVESAEFRHGPAEMLDRRRADMVFLLGTDESREMTERSLAFAGERGARTVAFDARRYAGLHPLLTPYVLKVPLQWFVVYSALMRGILDLDERVFMGHQVLSGAQWP